MSEEWLGITSKTRSYLTLHLLPPFYPPSLAPASRYFPNVAGLTQYLLLHDNRFLAKGEMGLTQSKGYCTVTWTQRTQNDRSDSPPSNKQCYVLIVRRLSFLSQQRLWVRVWVVANWPAASRRTRWCRPGRTSAWWESGPWCLWN